MDPKNHPNGYVTLSVSTVTGFIIYECQKHGLVLDDIEAAFTVGFVASAFHFGARFLGGKKA